MHVKVEAHFIESRERLGNFTKTQRFEIDGPRRRLKFCRVPKGGRAVVCLSGSGR